jgi:hypothetical protein
MDEVQKLNNPNLQSTGTRDQVLQPYKTTGKIKCLYFNLYNLDTDWKAEDSGLNDNLI